MKNLTQEELSTLKTCQSEQDWGDACDAIKEARGGMYPDDWWDKVKLSGMMDKILARWGADSSLRSVSLTRPPFKHTADGKDRSE
jgi:hypothetical protein